MVSNKNSDWPPTGWKVQFKIKNGRKIKYYTNSKIDQKFYSKPTLLRYIEDGCVSSEKLEPVNEHAKKSSGKIQMDLVEANDFEWLPTGWILERRIRKSGARAGTQYKCFIDPSTGTKFFSKPEVLRYLKSKQRGAGSSRRKDRRGSGCSSNKRFVGSQMAHKSNLEPEVSRIPTRVRKSPSSGKLKVVTERTVDEELPSGWIKEMRIKMWRSKVVRRDPFYIDPGSSLVFRSKLDVLRYVETGEVSRHAFQRRNESFNGEDFATGKTSTSSSKQEETPKSNTKEQVSAAEACSSQALPKAIDEVINKRRTRSSSRVRSAPAGEDMVVATALLEKVSGTSKTDGMTKQTPTAVPNADTEVKTLKKSKLPSAPSEGIFPEVNPVAVTIQGCSNGKAQTSKRKTKDTKLPCVPSRSSKRLAGVDAEVVYHPIPIEHALRATNRISSRTNPISSLVSVQNELQDEKMDNGTQDCIDHALQATSRKSSKTLPIPSFESVPKDLQEKCQDVNTIDMLASQEEKHRALKAGADFALTTQGKPSNKIGDLTSQEEKHCTLDVNLESVLTSKGGTSNKIDNETSQGKMHRTLEVNNEAVLATYGVPSNKIDDSTLPEEKHCRLDVDTETVLTAHGEPSNKIHDLTSEEEQHHTLEVGTQGGPSNNIVDLTSQEEKHHTSDVDPDTVLATQREPATKIDHDLTTKSSFLIDLNDLQLEQAPPGFSENAKVEASSTMTKQSLEHPKNTLLRSKVENISKGRPIPEDQKGSIIGRGTEQPQSEFCFPPPLWSDPCLEFAYKTLTGAIPFDDNLAIQDYIQHQLRTSEESNDNQCHSNMCAPSFFKNEEAKMVSPLPEDVNFPEIKQVKNK